MSVPPFPGIDKSATTLEPVQPSAMNGHTMNDSPSLHSKVGEMPEQEEGAPVPQQSVELAPEPYKPHIVIHYKLFFTDKPPYETNIIVPDIVDIRTVREYNSTINLLMQQHADMKPTRVVICGWQKLERG